MTVVGRDCNSQGLGRNSHKVCLSRALPPVFLLLLSHLQMESAPSSEQFSSKASPKCVLSFLYALSSSSTQDSFTSQMLGDAHDQDIGAKCWDVTVGQINPVSALLEQLF